MDEYDVLLDEIADPEDCVPMGAVDESNDDGIESFAGTDFVDELYSDGGDDDEHGVDTTVEAQATNKNDFKIDHSKGSFRMKRQYTEFSVPSQFLCIDDGGVYSSRELHITNERTRFRCNPSARNAPTKIHHRLRKEGVRFQGC
ncbi:hypothetical protein NW767_015404 [Fusarium falciforme]|uniref:Uncharacterized protein n=1 Tax=Fusarium falciforme TaxID=195108 RepID=A0A9W8URM0_9HYPO|nr:hypothetical protein NW755_014741 [Fusarium falciforme]KAJ4176569.1 hypothetical protein NW767_015404 [Fusarium falciforme]KAJ4224615.1 hypothetical protein NW757_014325 [Fusarium falciforme]